MGTMSSLRRFGGGSLLKFSAQMASNWVLFRQCSNLLRKPGRARILHFRRRFSRVDTLCSGTQSSQIIVGKHSRLHVTNRPFARALAITRSMTTGNIEAASAKVLHSPDIVRFNLELMCLACHAGIKRGRCLSDELRTQLARYRQNAR